MKRAGILTALLISAGLAAGAGLPRLKVSGNGRFLVTEGGEPFFYLADTAWELFHRLTREEAAAYLDARAAQRFNVVQAVALAELDGITVPNAYGDLALAASDPTKPVARYWEHVEYVIDEANRRGIYVALLPAWGSWVTDRPVVTAANAQAYGEFLGRRFGKKGIVWVLGGDRNPAGFEAVWRALARGIAIGVSGREDYSALLMTFHPRGGSSSSAAFHEDAWLDFNMNQNGHSAAAQGAPWLRLTADYQRSPVKPVLDGEPLYEDHPLGFRARELGYSFDAHVRQYAYADVFSGACGHTYGNHAVWQMYAPGRKPVNGPLLYWKDALDRPGAKQMQRLRALVESRPYLSRVPDQSLVVNSLEGADRITAARGDGYVFVYSPQGRRFEIALGRTSGERVTAWWYNPRSGTSEQIGTFDNRGTREFVPPSEGFGSDWVLVLDDAARRFGAPGAARQRSPR